MSERLLSTPDGSVPVFLDPVVAQLGGLNQEQVKAGCAFNMFPPFRSECHATGKEHAVFVGATSDPDPDNQTECEFNGSRIPHWYVIGPTHPLQDPQQPPSEHPSPTSIPAPFPSDDPENWTSHQAGLEGVPQKAR